MRYISLFSGIEAATVAWEPLGWQPVAFSEIEKFPCDLLKQRYPDVPNLGDVTKIDWKEVLDDLGTVDLIVGGSPCQSFSIAGGRESLDGESRLMFEFIRAVEEVRPRWVLWENVPGALTAKGSEGERGGAFRQLLDELCRSGYGLAWRVLDSQYARVPDGMDGWVGPVAQRRRRLFLVGHLGDPRRAGEVLLEREGMRGDLTSSRAKRQELAASVREGSEPGSYTLKIRAGKPGGGKGPLIQDDVSATLSTSQDQTLFQKVPAGFTISGFAQYKPDDAGTLRAAGGDLGGGVRDIDCTLRTSNGEDFVGALCARDWKGVGNQYVSEGKVIAYAVR